MKQVMVLLLLTGCAATTTPAAGSSDPLTDLSAEDLAERARKFQAAGDYVRAEHYLVAAVGRGYPERAALEGLLRACLAGARYHSAIRYVQSYVEQNPQDWQARYMLASLRHAVADDVAARSELDRVISAAPESPSPRFLMAAILESQGDHESAEAQLRRYLELAPKGEHAAEARARLQIPSGQETP